MDIVRSVKELKAATSARKTLGSMGFVPTMGALHAGHISLVDRCRKENATVIVSLFVNPTQFNDKNDLKNYPRTEDADVKLLEKAGCDIVFIPSVEEIYPTPDTRKFNFGALEEVMEGAYRPGHFNGVAQVVSKLFDMVSPDKAYFGEKDFQQVAIIRKMTKDLNLGLDIITCPIKREVDSLAMSSRNTLLTEDQRVAAPLISMTLKEAVARKSLLSVDDVKRWVIDTINLNPLMEVDYFEIVNAETLQPVSSWIEAEEIQGCIAVKLEGVRLIDNIKFA